MLKIHPLESQSESLFYLYRVQNESFYSFSHRLKTFLWYKMKFNTMQQKLQEGFRPSVVRGRRALYQESYLSAL